MFKGPTFKGLTWDHPRGFNALDAAAKANPALGLSWDKHSLEGFEAHPIADLCTRYDLVVLDHPHVGEAVAAGCLVPLEDLFSVDEIAGLARDCIGPSLSSYRFAGKHWALPLDAATQVMVCRPEIERPPVTWDEVRTFDGPVALSLAGPHAALSFQSICTAVGLAPAREPDVFVDMETGLRALDLMADLAAKTPLSVRDLNPIGLLGHMTHHRDVVLCPLVYGYVNYANDLRYANAPKGASGRIGSTLGGTGIGVSTRCEMTPQLMEHLRWLMSPQAQIGFIPAHDGQPSLRTAWRDDSVNVRWGQFYARTFDTLEQAYVRPRHNRAIAFQTEASHLIRSALYEGGDHNRLLADLQTAYERTHVAGSEI